MFIVAVHALGASKLPANSAPRREAGIVDVAEAGNYSWQAQSVMHNFEKRIITISKDSVIKLHDSTPPQVRMPVFLLVRKDISQDFVEQRSQLLGGLSSFRRVFCVDDKDIVQGIVSLSDLFRFITGREDLEPAPESTM